MAKRATETKKRWNARTYERMQLYWRKDDGDVCRMMASVPSRNGYVLSLIRKDIEERKRDGRWDEDTDDGLRKDGTGSD